MTSIGMLGHLVYTAFLTFFKLSKLTLATNDLTMYITNDYGFTQIYRCNTLSLLNFYLPISMSSSFFIN